MASPPGKSTVDQAIGGFYLVDPAQSLPLVGGGLPAYAVTDRRTGQTDLMALPVARHLPPRARALQALTTPIEGVLTPLAHGTGPAIGGEPGYFVICHRPAGAPLTANLQPWSEPTLIELVLRPLAQALEQLRARGMTHRSIRAENVFHPQAGHPVVLGAAWSAPPAMHQPAVYEPPYSAMCIPTGRGDGTIGDDVYALGVLLVVLALGRVPMAGLDEPAIIRRKLELGSYAALVGEDRLPPGIADLAGGMLAEEPDHRPPLRMLLDLAAARGRKVATRPPHRAPRPMQIGKTTVWNLRMLAYAVSSEPEYGLQTLSGITLMPWLRRGLGETALAVRIEELLRFRVNRSGGGEPHADSVMAMQIIALIDPLAPLCWNGVVLWPDGLGPTVAMAQARDPALLASLEALVSTEALTTWAAQRPERCDIVALRLEARQYRAWLQQRGPSGGLARVAYMLNPMLPCGSPLVGQRWVSTLNDLPAALEAAAPGADHASPPVDSHTAAFIAARSDRRVGMDTNALNGTDPDSRLTGQLRLLSELQTRFDPRPLPALAGWFAAQAAPLVARWRNRAKRAEVTDRLTALAAEGQLVAMLALIEDPTGHAADAEGAEQARQELARIDGELAEIDRGGADRAMAAARTGQEIAAGLGLAALATALILAAVG
jgi:hypothetical protein